MDMDKDPREDPFLLYRFHAADLRPDLSLALKAAGYPEGQGASPQVVAQVEKALALVEDAVDLQAVIRFVDLEFSQGKRAGFALPEGPGFSTHLVSRVLSRANQWAGFAVTLGEKASALARENRESLLLSYCLDAMASLFAETLADRLQERVVADLAESGLVSGYRYSPGYCDWPHADNRALIGIVEAHRIGIRLTSGGMMIPEKSVSGVMGFGLPESGVLESPCRRCGNTTCTHRREARIPPRA
ncbi:MAG: hypothetical protein KKA60_06725 [Proteobacteria bacterium]|nr:hypothetical protein [Pseudomonadota bacterium]